MLAARLPGNSTYDNPRCGQIRGCRGLPHSLAPLTGRPGRWPYSAGRTCTSKNAGGNAGSARGGRLPGVPCGGQPRVGPDPADAGGLPYPR